MSSDASIVFTKDPLGHHHALKSNNLGYLITSDDKTRDIGEDTSGTPLLLIPLLRSKLDGLEAKLGSIFTVLDNGAGNTIYQRLVDIKTHLIGGQTTTGVASILENSYFNAQQTTQSVSIDSGQNGNSTSYNLQKYNKVSVIIKETQNAPAVGAYAILEWSDNDDVFVSQGTRVAFANNTRADNSTSLGFWATFEVKPVMAKYMRVGVYNGGVSNHTYDIDVNFIH